MNKFYINILSKFVFIQNVKSIQNYNLMNKFYINILSKFVFIQNVTSIQNRSPIYLRAEGNRTIQTQVPGQVKACLSCSLRTLRLSLEPSLQNLNLLLKIKEVVLLLFLIGDDSILLIKIYQFIYLHKDVNSLMCSLQRRTIYS